MKHLLQRTDNCNRFVMNLVRPRLVTFDVTGTLLMTALEVHYAEIASQHGLSVDPNKLSASFKNNMRKLAVDHPIYGRHTGLGWENWWRTIVFNVFRDQNKNSPTQILDKVATSLIDCYGTNKCWHHYPDTMNILEYLKKKNVILGVISNFDERLESVLVSTNLRHYFSFVITSYRVGIEKPDPSIFEEALKLAKELHNVSVLPHEAVHVGDTVDKDYLGARNARWNAILVNRTDHPVQQLKVARNDIFHNLDDLQQHFDKVFELHQTNVH